MLAEQAAFCFLEGDGPGLDFLLTCDIVIVKHAFLFLAFSLLIACIYLFWPTGNDPNVGSLWFCSSFCFSAEYAACVTDMSSAGLWVNFSTVKNDNHSAFTLNL